MEEERLIDFIIRKLLADLGERAGFDDVLIQVDPAVMAELRGTWYEIIHSSLKKAGLDV